MICALTLGCLTSFISRNISFSSSSIELDYAVKKPQYIAAVNSSKKGSYSITPYYSEKKKQLEQFTGDIFRSPLE